jgi:hypothetical protein
MNVRKERIRLDSERKTERIRQEYKLEAANFRRIFTKISERSREIEYGYLAQNPDKSNTDKLSLVITSHREEIYQEIQAVYTKAQKLSERMNDRLQNHMLEANSFIIYSFTYLYVVCLTKLSQFPVWWPGLKSNPTVTHACRKRRLKWVPSAWGYSWATLSPGVINTEAWSSRLGVGRWTNNPAL